MIFDNDIQLGYLSLKNFKSSISDIQRNFLLEYQKKMISTNTDKNFNLKIACFEN